MWRAHVSCVAAPEGYDLAPLLAALTNPDESRPVKTIDVDALVAAAIAQKDSEVGAALKAFQSAADNAGKPLPADLLAQLVHAQVDADRSAGLEAKLAPPPEPAAEEGADDAAKGEEEAEPAPPRPDAPPPADRSADVYYVLKGFPRSADDCGALTSAGVGLDSLITLQMDSAGLAASKAAAAAAAADAGAKGKAADKKGAKDDKAKKEEPAADAPADDEGPTELPPPALTEALSGPDGPADCARVSLGEKVEAADWADNDALAVALAIHLYALAQKRMMFDDFKAPLTTVAVPAAAPADGSHYARLADAVPAHALGVAYLVHCLVEQVAHTAAGADVTAAAAAESDYASISAYLDAERAKSSEAPKPRSQLRAEAAAEAAHSALLLPAGDAALARAHALGEFGAQSAEKVADGDAALAAERAVYATMSLPGANRRNMPSSPDLTDDERGIERTELHHFSRFAPSQIDGAMQLRAFAALVNGADPNRGRQGSTGWLFADRSWSADIAPEVFAQTLVGAYARSPRPMRLLAYHPRDDALLFALHTPVITS